MKHEATKLDSMVTYSEFREKVKEELKKYYTITEDEAEKRLKDADGIVYLDSGYIELVSTAVRAKRGEIEENKGYEGNVDWQVHNTARLVWL